MAYPTKSVAFRDKSINWYDHDILQRWTKHNLEAAIQNLVVIETT